MLYPDLLWKAMNNEVGTPWKDLPIYELQSKSRMLMLVAVPIAAIAIGSMLVIAFAGNDYAVFSFMASGAVLTILVALDVRIARLILHRPIDNEGEHNES